MNKRLTDGFIAGAVGAIILVAIMYIMKATGIGEDPAFISIYRGTFGAKPPTDQVIAALLFVISGGIWGLIYGALVKHPTVVNGMLFGILPTLWLWVAVNGYMGKPLFNGFTAKGLIMPIIFNVVIWGTFVGWYMSKRIYDVQKDSRTI